jgi:hypothetical protein
MLILLSAILGGMWRATKGCHGGGPVATWTFVPLCAFATTPAWHALDLGEIALLCVACGTISGLFLLVKADNGGNGRPLLRFGPFGLGYWLAGRYIPERWAQYGEPFLGASWFGFVASVCAITQ